ncbi:MAG: MBL fold metallo-hydrolase, partial [Firmicutes bacterium]|nr:MBL fold metallo-hydrolase [Candidatus Caballimonas caccae]
DKTFTDGDELNFGDLNIKVVATPGHTDGSVTFVTENNMFTGDTLFHLSIGRSDFPTGNKDELIKSVKKLFSFSGDYNVYPGHEEFTTLEYERENNSFVDYD